MSTDSAFPRLIRRPQLKAKLGNVSDKFLADQMKAGEFPSAIVLSRRSDGLPAAVAWNEPEIDAWLDARRVKPAVAPGSNGKTMVNPAPAQAPKRRGRKAIAG